MTNEEYRALDCVNQSSLKLLRRSPKAFKFNVYNNDSIAFVEGDAVDTLLTNGEDAFHSKFYVGAAEKPTGKMAVFVKKLLELNDLGDTPNSMFYQEAYDAGEWSPRAASLGAIIKRFEDNFLDYYKEQNAF